MGMGMNGTAQGVLVAPIVVPIHGRSLLRLSKVYLFVLRTALDSLCARILHGRQWNRTTYISLYIYIYRERDIDLHIYIYIYIYICQWRQWPHRVENK